jgi:hypothetical protein
MFWGILSILTGGLLCYGVVRVLFRFCWRIARAEDIWFIASQLPFLALGVYLVWLAKNELARASGQEVAKPRVRWGRLLLGFCIAFFSVESHFSPSPKAFRAENEDEATGMLVASFTITTLGLITMALAFKPAKKKSVKADGQNAG